MALVLSTLAIPAVAFCQGFGNSEQIHEWQFRLESVPQPESWRAVTVPHDWSVEYPADPDNASCTGYLPGGVGLYQTELNIPQSDSGKRFYLYFEGVYNRSEVFVNGQSVGYRPNGYVSFMYDITDQVAPGEENSVSVRVDHSLSADSRWYTGSGIYRPVRLITANPLHLALWGVSYSTSMEAEGAATLTVNTELSNHLSDKASQGFVRITHELRSPDGERVATKTITQTLSGEDTEGVSCYIEVPQVRLWNLEQPTLYTLKTTLSLAGETIDSSRTRVGFRSFEFDADKGFALNGKSMKIKGVCLHHDAGALGAAVPKEVWRERLLTLKEIGVNGIRMSHNPQASALYDLCDELGFLVMDEAFDEWEYPKKKWIEGWNQGSPGFQGPADFFHEWGERDLAAMVKRDRNHPSIIMWSIGNEVDYPNDPYSHPILDEEGIDQQHVAGYQKDQPPAERLGAIAKRLAAVVRELDPSRPVTAALAGAVMSNETEYPGALDVVGYNYTESRYQQDHQKYPDRVLYGSENRHDLAAWKAVTDNDFIFGQFIWTGFDYLGESGRWPSRGFTSGMVDLANNIKPRGHFRRALWSDKPVAYLGTYLPRDPNSNYLSMDAERKWDYDKGQLVRVVCYTNGEEAELFLDGQSIGPRKAYDPQTAIIVWSIPFQKGELEVVSYKDGTPIASDTLRPDGKPKSLVAKPSQSYLQKKYDVAIITVTIVDEQGQLVYGSDHEITCAVQGAGNLLAMENASRDASENHRDNVANANHGTLVAYIQATADSGPIEVTFSAEGLKPTTARLQIAP